MSVSILRCFPKPNRAVVADQLQQVVQSVPDPDDAGLLSLTKDEMLAGLSADSGDALSRIVQLLACGEESAMHIFYIEGDRLGGLGGDFLESQSLMYRIAKEETLHDDVLTRLSTQLPYDDRHQALRKMARRFYLRLAHPEPKYHFFRISELDSVVCMVMHGLLTGTGKLQQTPALAKIAQRIRDDEARHVRITRDRLKDLGMTLSERLEESEPIRTRIIEMLSNAQDAFEELGVDATSVFKRVLNRKVT